MHSSLALWRPLGFGDLKKNA